MQKIILLIALLASLQLFAQTKKNKKADPSQEELKINLVASIQQDSLLLEPIVKDSKIFSLTKGNKFNCLDTTGKLIWQKQLSDKLAAQPIFDQSIALLGFTNGDLTKINTDSGEIVESVGIGDSINSNLLKIDYHWQNELMIPKISNSKGATIFSTGDGTIHCIDIETFQEYWTNPNLNTKTKSQIVNVNNKIIFIGTDNSIYCLDAKNGLLIWRWKGNEELVFVNNEIRTDGRFIFLVSSENNLLVIDTLLGKLEWVIEGLKIGNNIGIQRNNKNILVVTLENQLLIVSLKERKVVNKIQLPTTNYATELSPIEYANQFFMASDSTLYLINLKTNKIYYRKLDLGKIRNLLPFGRNKFLLTLGNSNLIIFEPRQY